MAPVEALGEWRLAVEPEADQALVGGGEGGEGCPRGMAGVPSMTGVSGAMRPLSDQNGRWCGK